MVRRRGYCILVADMNRWSARIRGARPSVASSSRRTAGFVASARPIANICCSPPDNWLPKCSERSPNLGKKSKTRSTLHCPAPVTAGATMFS